MDRFSFQFFKPSKQKQKVKKEIGRKENLPLG
jgi:hypothetical protein